MCTCDCRGVRHVAMQGFRGGVQQSVCGMQSIILEVA
jgi:hypothetical protein